MQVAADRLATRLLARGGQALLYYRGETEVSLDGVKSRSDYRQRESEHNLTAIADWDFVVKSADLGLEPQRGDYLHAELDGTLHKFLVSAPDGQHFFWALDHDQFAIRIHTNLSGPVVE